MKKTLLLAFSIAFAACGDDAPPEEDNQPEDPAPKDASRPDAEAELDAARDAAPSLLDATIEADAGDVADASEPIDLPDANVVDAASFDAQVADAGNDAGAMCVAEGEDCQVGACCDGTACVTSSAAPFPACLATCDTDSECDTGCCTALSGSAKVCAAASYCEQVEDPTAALTNVPCFNSLKVFDRNGKYLGDATARYGVTDGVCNDFGTYGKFNNGTPNMWDFGSDALNTSSVQFSARLGCTTAFPVVAYVSKYKGTADKRIIDPDNLCEVLRNSNL